MLCGAIFALWRINLCVIWCLLHDLALLAVWKVAGLELGFCLYTHLEEIVVVFATFVVLTLGVCRCLL